VKAGRGIYDCDHESATTARSARSTNTRHPVLSRIKLVPFFLAREFDGFHPHSLLVESKFDQRENFFTDGVQVNLHVRSSNLAILCNILEKDGQIKSKRL